MKNGLMYNEENLSRVPRELQQSLNEFENAILDIFGVVEGLNQPGVWNGGAYEAFKNECYKIKREEIDTIINSLEGWVSGTDKIAIDAVENTAKNKGYFVA